MYTASGVATWIEFAHARHALPHPPQRSIVLLAVTGEEKGLLGSRAFALNPPSAVGRMVADLNLDMFLPIVPLRAVVAFGVEESELGDWFKAIADSSGIKVEPDPEPEQTIFVRSDQYNLVRACLQSLFATSGDHGVWPMARRSHAWNQDHYIATTYDLR